MSLRDNASQIAGKGRFGDDALLHVSQEELRGLASLMPGGQLTINPDTGLPEAFFFLPFLGAMGAAAAPAAAAAAAPALAATAGAGALGAGMTAGMSAATGALGAMGAAAPTLASMAPTALTAAAPTALTAAAPTALSAAAPTALTAAATPAAQTALTAAAPTAATAATAPTQAGISALVNQAHAAPAIMGPGSMPPASVTAIPPPIATPTLGPNPASLMGQGAFSPTGPMTQATSIPQVGDLAAGLGPEPFAGAVADPAMATIPMDAIPAPHSALGGMEGAGGISGDLPMTGTYYGNAGGAFPPAPEAASQGGIGGLMGQLGNIDLMKLAPLAMMMPKGGGKKKEGNKKDTTDLKYDGGDPVFPGSEYRGGIDPEWNYFPRYAHGGPVQRPPLRHANSGGPLPGMPSGGLNGPRKFAEGGLASLAPQPQQAAPAGNPQEDEMLIEATVQALQGQVENADQIIEMFVQTFGEQALQELIASLQGGGQQQAPAQPAGIGGLTAGPGDGMSDSIPTSIDGTAPAALSTGEYVVPADVVSGLGNGSTDAGAAQLDDMMGRVRMARGGSVQQPGPINPMGTMPI